MSVFRFAAAASLFFSVLGTVWAQDPVDPLVTQCEGYAGDPEPGTPEFLIRDLQNIYCSEQRNVDLLQHPINYQQQAQLYGSDPYRVPELHNGIRFRHQELTIAGAAAEVFRPCSAGTCSGMPAGLETFEPPYPVAIVLHGLASDKRHLWWAAQPLAERGYFVITINGTGNSLPFDLLDWVNGEGLTVFPGDIDVNRVGITGHSLGAENSTRTQGDARVSAIVGWDPCNSPAGCSNSPGSRLHDKGAEAQTPTLIITADYSGFPGYAQPRTSVPGTLRAAAYGVLRDNGVDSMLITPRATTHLDWAGTFTFGSRYNEATSAHYTLAWFDRYVRGKLLTDQAGNAIPSDGRNEAEERSFRQDIAQQAFERLTATHFDDTVDTHNISQGFYDPVLAAMNADPNYGGNVPYAMSGKSLADRLSFYYRSVCFVSAPDYSKGNGDKGDPVLARGDSTAEGDMRMQGCPVTVTVVDTDADGIADGDDNCPTIANADQADTDADGLGDACDAQDDTDTDGDGVRDAIDNCPADANADQADDDHDGIGNVCDATPAAPLTVALSADPSSGDITDGPLTVTFTANAESTDPQGGTISYVYYFGDGTNSGIVSQTIISHDYDKAGNYQASVVVVDENNNSARDTVAITTTTTVTVDPDPIVVEAVLSVQLSGNTTPVTAMFDASGSTAPEGAIYRFDFGNGDVQEGTSQLATRTYALAGSYTVTLTVTDANDANNTDTTTAIVTVGSGQQTTVQLVVTPTTANIGQAVSFDASASIAAEGTQIVSFEFDFGDGTVETRTVSEFGDQAGIASHAYGAAGTYSPTVTVTDSSQAQQQASLKVKVNAAPPPVTDSPAQSGGGALGWLVLLPLLVAGLRRRIQRG